MKRILTVAAITFFASSAQADDVLKWAHEESNGDGVWNYSYVNPNFRSANGWNNFATSTDAYEGRTSMHFEYLNQDSPSARAFGFALIPTGTVGGQEAQSIQENDLGRDLSGYDALEFYVKGTAGANVSKLHVWLRSPNGHGSKFAPLKDYVTVDGTWKKVSIPVSAFRFPEGQPTNFQINNVNLVGLYVTQDEANEYANVPFALDVDNLSFVKHTAAPEVRKWWSEDANHNGEYNYSTTSHTGGATINVANQWNDVVISDYMTGPFGNTPIPSVDLRFTSNARGYAEAALTTSRDNSGYEPVSFEDRDAGKSVRPDAVLKFASPGVSQVSLKLVDSSGHESRAVSLENHHGNYGRYTFDYAVPVSELVKGGFDLDNVQRVVFFVNKKTPAGDHTLHVINLRFDRP